MLAICCSNCVHASLFLLQWRRGQIALCRNTIVSRFSRTPAEDNWVTTQFIKRATTEDPTHDLPITVNVTHSFLSCTPKTFAVYYYPSVSDPGSSEGIHNYRHIGRITTTNKGLQTSSFTFNLTSQYSGFYLGFRDQDSCGTIQRCQVYRDICPSRKEGMAIYPETPVGTSAVPVTHQCIENAEVSDEGLMCHPDGSWSGLATCSCVAGHVLERGQCRGIIAHHNALTIMI